MTFYFKITTKYIILHELVEEFLKSFTICRFCEKDINFVIEVTDHCHRTGKYRDAAHKKGKYNFIQ